MFVISIALAFFATSFSWWDREAYSKPLAGFSLLLNRRF